MKQCLKLLKSDAMFLLLSNLTGIRLHPLASVDDDDDDEEDEEGKEGEEVPEEVLEREKSPMASSSKMEEEKEKGKKDQTAEEEGRGKGAKKKCEPKCAAEVRRWKQVGGQ